MPTPQKNAITQKLVTLTRNLQPQVSIVGNYLQFRHQRTAVRIFFISPKIEQ